MRLLSSVKRAPLVLTAFVSLSGCGSDPLEDEGDVRTWANTASAVAVYAHGYEPIAFADGQAAFSDPDCPRTSDDGTEVTIRGGCTDASGQDWIGEAVIVRSEAGDRSLTLDDYGHFDDPDRRAGATGSFDLRRIADDHHEFEVDLVHRGGMTTTFLYAGSVRGTYDAKTTWSGHGEVSRDGFVAPTGTIVAKTVDEVIDNDVCAGQPLSGTTTLERGDHVSIVTYDGETDCDADQNARLSSDGVDRGFISGIACGLGRGDASPAGPLGLAFSAALLLAARSRRAARFRRRSRGR